MLIGYARVSTADQCADLQLDALRASGCERVFVEMASGAERNRPKLKAAMRVLKRGDTFVVWKLDRLARSLQQLLVTLERLDQRQVRFLSIMESIDTNEPYGRAMYQLLGLLAELERNIIRERTKAGLAAARERGRIGGRPRKLSDSDVVKARAARLNGMSVPDLAAQFGVGASTLYRRL